MRLLESNVRRARRRGGLVTSVGAHVIVIWLAVAATGSARVPAAAEERPEHAVWVPPRQAAPPAPEPSPSPAGQVDGATSAPAPPLIDVPALPEIVGETAAVGPVLPDPSADLFDRSSRPLGAAIGPTRGQGGGAAIVGAPMDAGEVERQVALLGAPPRPRYPEALRDAGVAGRVVVRFVVDTAGRVEPGTLAVVVASHPLFVPGVASVAARLRFRPAEAMGRRVRQLVEMPFEFVLGVP